MITNFTKNKVVDSTKYVFSAYCVLGSLSVDEMKEKGGESPLNVTPCFFVFVEIFHKSLSIHYIFNQFMICYHDFI